MTSHFFCYDVTLFCYDVTLFCGTGSTSSDCPSAEEAVAIAGGIIGAIVVCIIEVIIHKWKHYAKKPVRTSTS